MKQLDSNRSNVPGSDTRLPPVAMTKRGIALDYIFQTLPFQLAETTLSAKIKDEV